VAAPSRVDHLLTFRFEAGARSYRRDLIVPAAPGASTASLIRQARAELPTGAASLKPFLTRQHAIEVLEGPPSRRRTTELR
jgi:hypothetical protein